MTNAVMLSTARSPIGRSYWSAELGKLDEATSASRGTLYVESRRRAANHGPVTMRIGGGMGGASVVENAKP